MGPRIWACSPSVEQTIMADMLLELGRSPRARALFGSLGLPLALPQSLTRARGGWTARELEGQRVAVLQLGTGHVIPAIAAALATAGAVALAPEGLLPSFEDVDGACALLRADAAMSGIVVDATGAGFVGALSGLQRELGGLLPRLRRCGRIVVVGKALDGLDGPRAAVQGALDGFVRSLAKEQGARGTTVNLLRVASGAEPFLGAPLTFLLSDRASFITAQPLHIGSPAAPRIPAKLHARMLVGKIALVTGAARGIGEATARALAAEGAQVVVLDRPQDGERAEQVARSIGGRALLVDLGAAGAVEQVIAGLGPVVDIVVHNAGITRDRTLARMRPEHWDQVMAINLEVITALHAALVAGPLADGGRVICLSSIAGIAGNMGQTAYAASKAGLIAFVAAEAQALERLGVTVNAVAPGFIETRMTAAVPLVIREAGRRLSALGQGGQPEDVAHAIAFLATPAAQGISGHTLRVCGGGFLGA
jgi:3-oxoacyl-[acyl-carrier protein] reductase